MGDLARGLFYWNYCLCRTVFPVKWDTLGTPNRILHVELTEGRKRPNPRHNCDSGRSERSRTRARRTIYECHTYTFRRPESTNLRHCHDDRFLRIKRGTERVFSVAPYGDALLVLCARDRQPTPFPRVWRPASRTGTRVETAPAPSTTLHANIASTVIRLTTSFSTF